MTVAVSVTFSRVLATGLVVLCALVSVAHRKKEVRCQVGLKAVISISNNYGPITIKPSPAGEVLITMVSLSNAVSFKNDQHKNHVHLRSISPVQGENLAEFIVLVPRDAYLTLQFSSGALRVDGLRGDLILETASGAVEVNDFQGGHVHVHTLSGPTTLAGIHSSHAEVNSVSGKVNLRDVTASSVVVYSGTGRIAYEGDSGRDGDYRLTTNAGDLEVSIPATSPVEINSWSMSTQSRPESPAIESSPSNEKSFLSRSRISGASVFVLRSLRGKIRTQRRRQNNVRLRI